MNERNTWSLTPRDTFTKRDTLDGPTRLSHRQSNHQWIVFKEAGIPYGACKNMHDLMTMIKEAAHVLGVIWREGRLVHGDLSLTNLLWYQGQALVINWGLCQSYDDELARYVRMGTPAYMAVEVSAQQWLYRRDVTQLVAFKHNPIHDLESLWRIMMWTFLGSVSSLLLDSMSPAQVHSQWTAYRLRFPDDRTGFSILGAESRGPYPTCSLKDLPQALVPITASIGVLAHLLQEWHVSPEDMFVESWSFTNSHAEFCRQLDKMLEELGETPYGPVMRLSSL